VEAKLRRAEDELNAERSRNTKLRQTLELEHQKETDAALSSMTMELVHKQGKALADPAKIIEQLEYYLSEGQKYLNHQYEAEEGGRRVVYDLNRREHEFSLEQLKAQKYMADRKAEIVMRAKAIHNRETAQMMREQQSVAINRKTIEAELRETMVFDMDDKLAELADTEYNSGFGAGKEAGRIEATEESRQNGFLEGYGACHRAQVALSNFRHGRITHDSPELAFLLDPAHPHNSFTMGTRIGYYEEQQKSKVQAKAVNVVKKMVPIIEEKEEPIVEQKEEPVVEMKFTQAFYQEERRQEPVRK
jgi:hypothetical protein